MSEKLVFLGGGSPFIPSTFRAILENKEALAGSEVCLMDLDGTRLAKLAELGNVMARRADVDLKITYTTDERKALEGATFVFPGYRVGGVNAILTDFTIPTRYGICGDETAGPGGTFMAQCTIPATLHYCRLMEELCPDAWAISYVNPTNFVADAVRRVTKTKFIAVCDCYPGFESRLSTYLGVAPKDVKARAIGVNHMTWLSEIRVRGKDAYPLLKEKVRAFEPSGESADTWGFALRLLDAYGHLMVCPSHPRMLWEHNKVLADRKIALDNPDPQGRQIRAKNFWQRVDAMIEGAPYDERLPFFPMHHPRHAVGIAVSILTNEGREWGGMNFPNDGAISNLPIGAIVEGHCIVDGRGPTQVALGALPKSILGITQHTLNWQDLTVDAALSGDKDVLYQALLASPYVHDMKAAKAIMDDLLVAHADYMPQFKS